MASCAEYRSKIVSPEVAVGAVTSGHRIYVHNGCAEPELLLSALVARGSELCDVEIMHMATFGRAEYVDPCFEGHFRHRGLFLAGNVRRAVQEGRGDYTPIFLHEIEGVIRSGERPIDVALLQCTPPDEHGYMSLGPSVDITHAVLDRARCVIVEINDQVPRTFGDTFVHVSRAHMLVESSHPLIEYPGHEITDAHRAIARRIANLIPDGAVLQTGIGGIPEAVLGLLGDHRDLGVHSEMTPDSVVDLMQSGVINNSRKSIHKGKTVAGFALGSKRLFDFMHNNPAMEYYRTEYVNDPFVIAQNERMVAINAALEVDLTGQVCSDSIGQAPFSGIGGQVDFIRGAARSKGGVPIIALPATAKDGAISRIVPVLRSGAGVVTSRGDVHWVITEYGTAYLHGKCIRERAEAMIQVAAPQFRDDLMRYAIENKLLTANPRTVAV